MRFEFWAVALAALAAAELLRITANERSAWLRFSFIDLIVDLLAPMEELLCGT